MKFRRSLLACAAASAVVCAAWLGLATDWPGLTSNASEQSAPAARRARQLHRRAVHRVVARTTPGTYLGRILEQRDSVLDRWPDRLGRPVRVWVADGAASRGWRPSFRARLAEALGDWEATGIPVRFTIVPDSAGAEVRVRWVDTLSERASGRTTWHANDRRWMTGADVWIAMRASDGAPQDDRGVKAIALHEIGHLLGLSHSDGREDIMAAWVAADTLSDGDKATARLLYALPPGRVASARGERD